MTSLAKEPSSLLHDDGPDVDIDLYGRAFDGIFGAGAENQSRRQALLKFKETRDRRFAVRIGHYVDRDLYGRGDPRIFGARAINPVPIKVKKPRLSKLAVRALLVPPAFLNKRQYSFQDFRMSFQSFPSFSFSKKSTEIEDETLPSPLVHEMSSSKSIPPIDIHAAENQPVSSNIDSAPTPFDNNIHDDFDVLALPAKNKEMDEFDIPSDRVESGHVLRAVQSIQSSANDFGDHISIPSKPYEPSPFTTPTPQNEQSSPPYSWMNQSTSPSATSYIKKASNPPLLQNHQSTPLSHQSSSSSQSKATSSSTSTSDSVHATPSASSSGSNSHSSHKPASSSSSRSNSRTHMNPDPTTSNKTLSTKTSRSSATSQSRHNSIRESHSDHSRESGVVNSEQNQTRYYTASSQPIATSSSSENSSHPESSLDSKKSGSQSSKQAFLLRTSTRKEDSVIPPPQGSDTAEPSTKSQSSSSSHSHPSSSESSCHTSRSHHVPDSSRIGPFNRIRSLFVSSSGAHSSEHRNNSSSSKDGSGDSEQNRGEHHTQDPSVTLRKDSIQSSSRSSEKGQDTSSASNSSNEDCDVLPSSGLHKASILCEDTREQSSDFHNTNNADHKGECPEDSIGNGNEQVQAPEKNNESMKPNENVNESLSQEKNENREERVHSNDEFVDKIVFSKRDDSAVVGGSEKDSSDRENSASYEAAHTVKLEDSDESDSSKKSDDDSQDGGQTTGAGKKERDSNGDSASEILTSKLREGNDSPGEESREDGTLTPDAEEASDSSVEGSRQDSSPSESSSVHVPVRRMSDIDTYYGDGERTDRATPRFSQIAMQQRQQSSGRTDDNTGSDSDSTGNSSSSSMEAETEPVATIDAISEPSTPVVRSIAMTDFSEADTVEHVVTGDLGSMIPISPAINTVPMTDINTNNSVDARTIPVLNAIRASELEPNNVGGDVVTVTEINSVNFEALDVNGAAADGMRVVNSLPMSEENEGIQPGTGPSIESGNSNEVDSDDVADSSGEDGETTTDSDHSSAAESSEVASSSTSREEEASSFADSDHSTDAATSSEVATSSSAEEEGESSEALVATPSSSSNSS